jgi:hypothetical protein
LLESDRANLLAKASQNITKLHAWDLTEEERAGAQSTTGILAKLYASANRLFELMHKERVRFHAVMDGGFRVASQMPLVNTNMLSIRGVRLRLENLLKRASTAQLEISRLVNKAAQRKQANFQPEQQNQPSRSL